MMVALVEAHFQSQGTSCEICGGTGSDFCPNYFNFISLMCLHLTAHGLRDRPEQLA